MHNRECRRSGFSLIEMLIATVLVLFLSATSYKILTGQGKTQLKSVFSQKQNTQLLTALDRFKKDASQIDFNWTKYKAAVVYPHQGLGLADNFYVNPLIRDQGLNDGVTFLKRDPQKASLYTLAVDAEYPDVSGLSVPLYGQPLTMVEPDVNISRNDWVIVFTGGKYALGVVSAISHSTPRKITLREPNAAETVETHINSVVHRSSGYVTKSGVVPASYDWDNTNTATADDDNIKFEKTKSYIQVVQPVSYELDWATNDKQPHGNGNSFVLNEDGNPKKVIVRTEYTGTGVNREYLAESNQLGITYDVLINSAGGMDGFTTGETAKDIGRENNSSIQFVNIISPDPDASGMGDQFVSTSNITSMRLFAAGDLESGQEGNQKFNEIRVALDPARINDQYQENSNALAQNSGDLVTGQSLAEGQRIGQPLYIKRQVRALGRPARGNQVYVPGSGRVDVVVPVGPISYNTDPKNPTPPENGKLLVLDERGDPATTNTSCSVANCEQITFKPKEGGQYFLPTTMVEKPSDGSGMNKILVGGFSIVIDGKGEPTRKPMMAEIEYPDNMQFRDFVAQHNTGSGDTCSLDTGCKLVAINEMTIQGSSSRLRDTAAGMAVDGEDVYMASVTRDAGQDSTISIYKTDTNFTHFKEQIVDDTGAISKNRVISAISQNPIEIAGVKYLPIATSRSIASGATPGEDGKILLYNLTTPGSAPIEIANHNFKVNSMASMNGNLVFSGKLVTQIMKEEDIAALIQGNQTTVPTYYTDELANYIPATGSTPAVKEYADGYFTLSQAYQNQSSNTYQQVLGWNTGFNATKTGDMSFGFVLGNQSYMNITSPKPATYQQQDFTTLSVNFGGMSERVIAAIDTDFNNLEASQVVAKYDKQESKLPNVLLPGVMYAATKPRSEAAPLPALQKTMDEKAWVAFYQDFVDIADHSANQTPIQYLPDPNAALFQCGNSVPPTCPAGP